MMLLQLAKMAFSNYFEANNNNSDNKAVHLKKKKSRHNGTQKMLLMNSGTGCTDKNH